MSDDNVIHLDAWRRRGRLPPMAPEFEKRLLGWMLLDDQHVHEVNHAIRGTDFYRQDHRFIYGALLEASGTVEGIVRSVYMTLPFRVLDVLRARGCAETCGGEAYLNELAHMGESVGPDVSGVVWAVRDAADARMALLEALLVDRNNPDGPGAA